MVATSLPSGCHLRPGWRAHRYIDFTTRLEAKLMKKAFLSTGKPMSNYGLVTPGFVTTTAG